MTSNHFGDLKLGHTILRDSLFDDLQKARQSAVNFFALDSAYKNQFIRTDHLELGYRDISAKEMFLIRDAMVPPELSACVELAKTFHQLSCVCSDLISEELQMDANLLRNLIDTQAFPNNSLSSSVLRIIHYRADYDLPTDIHEDLGLLTFVTHTGVPALEIYDFKNDLGWVDVEAQQNETDVIVMAGESLSFVSNGYYIPAPHRVRKPTRTRIAINYHLRLKQDVILDSNDLTTAVTGKFSKPFHLTAGEFLNREIQLRSSVNGSY